MRSIDPFGRTDQLGEPTLEALVLRLTQQRADAWAAGLLADSGAGLFFASCNYHAYVARRP